jgi:hypothetical protein
VSQDIFRPEQREDRKRGNDHQRAAETTVTGSQFWRHSNHSPADPHAAPPTAMPMARIRPIRQRKGAVDGFSSTTGTTGNGVGLKRAPHYKRTTAISGWREKSIHVKSRTTAIPLHGIVRFAILCDWRLRVQITESQHNE